MVGINAIAGVDSYQSAINKPPAISIIARKKTPLVMELAGKRKT